MSTTKPFLDDHFLLDSPTAQRLYHEYARDLPIIDYHCHLPPDEIAGNRKFDNLTEIWLHGDHYKWRAMRTLGIDEKYITGSASDQDKFRKWAYTVPFTMRNPLYHWTHLELRRYFDIDTLLDEKTADQVYAQANEALNGEGYRVRDLLRRMKVEVVCTTDDPVDDLGHHQALQGADDAPKVLPAFRPDKSLMIGKRKAFKRYLANLASVTNLEIIDLDSLLQALDLRMDYFHARGCRLSDHGLEKMPATEFTHKQADKVLKKVLKGKKVDAEEIEIYQTAVLQHLCLGYHERGWTQQFHLGALRNNNKRMEGLLGPDTGFDSIGDWKQASALSWFLDRLDGENRLAKTILYNLNPGDNEVLATMTGNFNDGSSKGKIQFGSGWWFLDQKDGMEKQMTALSNMGLISCFVGMLTDSRSFLSYPRHEYFRRLVCNLFGQDVEQGLLPNDLDWIGKLVSDICYHNARNYFEF